MKAFITVGIPASGKTTWAIEYAKKHGNVVISNRDDLRFSITGASGWSDYKFKDHTENMITEMQIKAAELAAKDGKDFILSDTNLNQGRNKIWEDRLKSMGFIVELVFFDVDLSTALRRDASRPSGVGHNIIYKMYNQYIGMKGRRTYTPDHTLSPAIMFDIDGTLVTKGNRSTYEWEKVKLDTVNETTAAILRSLYADNRIIIMSGRDSICKTLTEEWLSEHNIPYHAIFMREVGDTRKDAVIKELIFWEHVAPYYNVKAVFDDRPVVVRMWHEINIPTVYAIGNQNIEF